MKLNNTTKGYKMNANQAAVQSFQNAPQQTSILDATYQGDLLIQFFDDVTIVQELNEIYIDMNEE